MILNIKGYTMRWAIYRLNNLAVMLDHKSYSFKEKHMTRQSHSFLYILTIITFLLMSAMPTHIVFADNGTSDDPPLEEPAPTEEYPLEISTDETIEDPPIENTISVSEVLEQVPDGSVVVVLNEDGSAEPLASQEAAEILIEGDPIWCPVDHTPYDDDNGCTESTATFADLVAILTTDASYQGDGVIWVESSYLGADANPIIFDGSISNLANLSDLTIQGGWSGIDGSKSIDPSNPSLLDVPLVITNWTGDIKINDLDFLNASSDLSEYPSPPSLPASWEEWDFNASLIVETNGDISLDNVSVEGNTDDDEGMGARLDNCLAEPGGCTATGDITVMNSDFSANAYDGLNGESSGDVIVKNVTATGNDGEGVDFDTNGEDQINSIVLNNLTVSNNNEGIEIDDVAGNVTLSNITATDNDADGIDLDNIGGNVTGTDLTATGNTLDGVDIEDTKGTVTLTNVKAKNNGDHGLELWDIDGDLTLTCVLSTNNGDDGINIENQDEVIKGKVIIKCSQANDNANEGIYIEDATSVQLLSATATGNGGSNILIAPGITDVVIRTIDCNPVPYSLVYTTLVCTPPDSTASLTNIIGDQVIFYNLCGYKAGIFNRSSDRTPKYIPGGEVYVNSIYEKVQALEQLQGLDTPAQKDSNDPGLYVKVLEELPNLLPDGDEYLSDLLIIVLEDGQFLDPLPADAEVEIRFHMPEGLDDGAELAILRWNGVEWEDLGGVESADGQYIQTTSDGIGFYVLVNR